MTFKQKLNISYTLIIVILITIITYSHYLIHVSNTKQNMSLTMNELSHQLSINLDAYLSELTAATMQPLYDRDQIERLISGKHLQDLSLAETIQLENYIRNVYLYPNSEDITAVHLFDNQMGSISLYQKGQRYEYAPESTDAFVEAKKAWGKSAVSGTFLAQSSHSSESMPIFSVLRQLNIFEINQPYGIIVLDVNFSKIDDLLRNIQIGSDSFVSIVNDQNEVIYSTNHENITTRAPSLNADDWLRAEAELNTAPWKLELGVPIKSVLNQKELLLNSLLIMAASILVAVMFSGWFSRKVTLSLEQLQRLMRKAESGEFNLRFHTKSRDEIYHLGNSFNHMLTQIKELIDRTYVAEIRQREAQFSALQSQINPHFLFNTLETIRMMAETEGNSETVKMIASLGKLLKVNFRQQSLVTMQQELEYVEHYLYLQSARLSYPPKFIIACDDSLKKIPIHALMIQPLVENSVLHGLRPLSRSGCIHVEVIRKEADSSFEIRVKDDGVGMAAERLEELRKRMQTALNESGQETSIGLLNVERRIQLSYGKKFGLEIDSIEGEGTTVTCKLPLYKIPQQNETGGVIGYEYISNGDRR
ncbi:sensor histidine kinase [Paenibacillus sp. HB172176]|uniref:cache domain-containing sensor histidine kinase n=1 Tax=Paenibacillus sp. HB172176 TaxID=2493690 RepID=UPI001439EFD3|nr:sensor histidine kinase [Paenibacillus sp. HB172176]